MVRDNPNISSLYIFIIFTLVSYLVGKDIL